MIIKEKYKLVKEKGYHFNDKFQLIGPKGNIIIGKKRSFKIRYLGEEFAISKFKYFLYLKGEDVFNTNYIVKTKNNSGKVEDSYLHLVKGPYTPKYEIYKNAENSLLSGELKHYKDNTYFTKSGNRVLKKKENLYIYSPSKILLSHYIKTFFSHLDNCNFYLKQGAIKYEDIIVAPYSKVKWLHENKYCHKCGNVYLISKFRKAHCNTCVNKRKYEAFKIRKIKQYGSWENYLKSEESLLKNKRRYIAKKKKHLEKIKDASYVDQYKRKVRQISKEKYYNNPWKTSMRNMFKNFLKRSSYNKTKRTHQELGYNWQQFKSRIEFNFKEGMTWANYGEWHVDHIKPLAAFEEGTPANICNALCNLQPLWANENMRKRDKWKL